MFVRWYSTKPGLKEVGVLGRDDIFSTFPGFKSMRIE